MRLRVVVAGAVVLASVALAAPAATSATTPPTGVGDLLDRRAAAGRFSARGSVGQVVVTHAEAGSTVTLRDASGARVARASADRFGSALLRSVKPGSGYSLAAGRFRARAITVRAADERPPDAFYGSQRLREGFGYLTTRDGTTLSIDVQLPGPVDDGPYPTVVEYSGYDPSNPDAEQPASRLARLVGYATVGVNLRGTGCSGGAFDYFEALQSLDGYDAVETIAAQPWVAHGKVGMVGISYSGITQLFVAATRPPHLAAITPMSVFDDTYSVMYPGGIFNDGFASSWASDRAKAAQPGADEWVQRRIRGGDTTCAENQLLRLQSPDVLDQIRRHAYYAPARDGALAPVTFVRRIGVPVFLAGTWQDEETGGDFANLLSAFDPSTPAKFTVVNGMHADSLAPAIAARWAEFLDFYVARRIPHVPTLVRLAAPVLFQSVYGVSGIRLPADRFSSFGSYQAALVAYQAEPAVRVLFESGAGDPAGAPVAAFEQSFPSWPPPAATTVTWYFTPGRGLSTDRPSADAPADHFTYDPAAFPRTNRVPGGGKTLSIRAGKQGYDWKPAPAGKALAYQTAPLAADTVVVGPGSVDLRLGSSATDVDLEVTISEVRPDGRETYVQSGWLRASRRKLDERASTALHPVPTYRAADASPLPAGRLTLVRVPLQPFAQVFRHGSRIRLTVQAPGGNRPLWSFAAHAPDGTVTNTVGIGPAAPSAVVLPVVHGLAVASALPACGRLRGQPCRSA